jgi:hypothetical protein
MFVAASQHFQLTTRLLQRCSLTHKLVGSGNTT